MELLCRAALSLTDYSRKVDSAFGLDTFLLVSSNFLNLITCCYFVVSEYINTTASIVLDTDKLAAMLIYLFWMVVYAVQIWDLVRAADENIFEAWTTKFFFLYISGIRQ
jgi:hypothetical protein